MISFQHHYGVQRVVSSTPIRSMERKHRFGAESVMLTVNNIERLREARGWKRPELARLMNTSPQQIERLEKGMRKLTQDWIDRAAEAFGVSPSMIITETDEEYAPSSDTPPTISSTDGDGPIKLRSFDLDYSMGDGTNIDDFVEEGRVDFDSSLLRKLTITPPHRLFVARGSGDSMFPTLVNGDMVIIDTVQKNLNLDDRIWAISLFGAGSIKRLRPVGKGMVEVISDNPARGSRVVEAADLHILGRVIWVGREV